MSRSSKSVLSSVVAIVLIAIANYLLFGFLVSLEFATSYWYVPVLGGVVGGIIVWLMRRSRQRNDESAVTRSP